MVLWKLRSGTRRKKERATEKSRYAQHEDVDGCATHNLVRLELDTAQGVDRGDSQSCDHAGEEPEPRARVSHAQRFVSRVSNCSRRESSGEHFSFEGDIDHARS